jgi:hypothetical protein
LHGARSTRSTAHLPPSHSRRSLLDHHEGPHDYGALSSTPCSIPGPRTTSSPKTTCQQHDLYPQQCDKLTVTVANGEHVPCVGMYHHATFSMTNNHSSPTSLSCHLQDTMSCWAPNGWQLWDPCCGTSVSSPCSSGEAPKPSAGTRSRDQLVRGSMGQQTGTSSTPS